MSLLLKALRQAEQSHASHSRATRSQDDGMDELALEPLASTLAKPKREWVELPSTDESSPQPGKIREWRWPLGLVPTTALLALFIAAAYGLYFYWMTRSPSWSATPPAIMSASSPVPPATPAGPLPEPLPAPVREESASVYPVAGASGVASPPVAHPKSASSPPSQQRSIAEMPPSAPATVAVPTSASRATLLEEAYAAFQAGRLDEARARYERANTTPNTDALLGLAAIAQAKGQTAEAIRLYQAVLDIAPRNAIAQAALLDTLGTTDPVAAESRIKSMIAREPSGFLFYALGNLYADQGRWSDAEHAYFDAHQREPGNADYAFNLAVSLDHLKQADAAVRYYETALRLAGPATRFDPALAEKRISQLRK